jgi:hypothetical protein
MKIKLQSGKEVYVEAFHCTPTYAGLLLGSPTKESNEILINHLSYPKNWGTRLCVIKKSEMYAYEDILKPIINSVWLSSSEAVDVKDKISNGSDLVIMWFSNELQDKSLQEIIIAGAGDINWERFASDFEF